LNKEQNKSLVRGGFPISPEEYTNSINISLYEPFDIGDSVYLDEWDFTERSH